MPTHPDTRVGRPWLVLLLAAAIGIAVLAFALVESSGSSGNVPTGPDGTMQIVVSSAKHVKRPVTYNAEPPAGGNHFEVWQNCGIYDEPLTDELVVHSMEHGAVWVTYPPNLPPDEIGELQGIVADGYVGDERYVVLSPYEELSGEIVASAWGRQLRVTDVADPRLPEFLQQFAGGPQSPESLYPCSDGDGTPLD